MSNHYVRLSNGSNIPLDHPTEDDFANVGFVTIAKALANTCRFNGACNGFYSVARHTAIGVKGYIDVGDFDSARHFLLHDAHEIVIGDITSPVGRHISLGGTDINHLKASIDVPIYNRFLGRGKLGALNTSAMDQCLLYHEWNILMPGHASDVGISLPVEDLTTPELRAMIRGGRYTHTEDATALADLAAWLGVS